MRCSAALLLAVAPVAAPAVPMPFVGCPADGQLGPQTAPRRGHVPDLPPAAAARLAFYAAPNGVGVLAPRGWRCLGSVGSDAVGLTVAPDPSARPPRGPAVVMVRTSGSTSGRFTVAGVAARGFPAAASYVAAVEAEGILGRPLPSGPYPADRRTYRGPWQLLFTTPAGRTGLGTRLLARGALPVDGVEWLHPAGDMDLTSLAVRLSPPDRPLVTWIIRQAAPNPRHRR